MVMLSTLSCNVSSLCFQLGTAIAVLAITAVRLGGVQDIQGLTNQSVCLLSGDTANKNPCYYAYAVGAISIVLTILIGLLQVGAYVNV